MQFILVQELTLSSSSLETPLRAGLRVELGLNAVGTLVLGLDGCTVELALDALVLGPVVDLESDEGRTLPVVTVAGPLLANRTSLADRTRAASNQRE